MAWWWWARAYIYDRAWTTLLYTLDPAESTDTISSILALSWNSWWTVTNLAASVWWTALSGSTTLWNSWSIQWEDYYLYDVTPQVITGFYLDGNKYQFAWGGWWVSMSTTTVTLTSAGWSSWEQTVSATWVTASNTVIVSPAPASIGDYADWGVYASAQWSGTLTFTAETEPENDIVVNVLIMS